MTTVERLAVLAHAGRWRIVEFLLDPVHTCCRPGDGVCGCDIEHFVHMPQPTVSYHMRRLIDAGLVTAERKGRWTYYRLLPDAFEELARNLDAIAASAHAAAREPQPS